MSYLYVYDAIIFLLPTYFISGFTSTSFTLMFIESYQYYLFTIVSIIDLFAFIITKQPRSRVRNTHLTQLTDMLQYVSDVHSTPRSLPLRV